MKRFIYLCLSVLALHGCQDNYYHDSGLADGNHDCTLLEYLENDRSNNWDSAVVAIRHCGLEDIFNGTDPEYGEGLTFFGFTNYSVFQFLHKTVDDGGERLYYSVRDIPVDICRKMVLCHLIRGKKKMQDFEYEEKGTLTGGTDCVTLTGITLRIYRRKLPSANGTPDTGADKLSIHARVSGHIANVASCNIQTRNAVVHSLRSDYQWTEL